MDMDQQTKADIELLLNVAREEIINAEGNPKRFNEIGKKYGPIAHRVYKKLDAPSKEPGNYHNKSIKAVLLDPWTVTNRMNSFERMDININPYEPELWLHTDMVKTLIDYLALTYLKEDGYASTRRT